ncbi:dihydroorotate dehydrogenase electron transfer subunit [Crateriforma conspicua]|uniref:dihydroorotate dehydrogenase electron transfer subunit n=1 Tax=Crateriforma conspicua TaxID=2527996 RepID=UPI00118C6C75|nr:dihydroorotate dehydrogenase electron transfer subunit [Crateriforma conspicua]QDV64942.1 Dihydroorotate dehydrogenase B (NAD(+)), electron transfer subunit [Crateriforma conspicua]
MTSLHADHYADNLVQLRSPLVTNRCVARDTFLCRIDAPEIAGAVIPGQFVMIRMAQHDAPLIGRAFAVWDIINDDSGSPRFIELIYLRKGTLTRALASAPVGTPMDVWGPLGNGFAARPCDRLIMTAGGIGQTPMLLLGKEAIGTTDFGREHGWASHVEIIYGARTAELLAGVEAFRTAGFEVTVCTDDGSTGQTGRVPDVLATRLTELKDTGTTRVVTCGPEIMMQRVSEVCDQHGVDCQVSMETPMACGIGICFSCVAKIRQDDPNQPWDYKRTCVEGPIFDSSRVHWDD